MGVLLFVLVYAMDDVDCHRFIRYFGFDTVHLRAVVGWGLHPRLRDSRTRKQIEFKESLTRHTQIEVIVDARAGLRWDRVTGK